MQEFNLDLDFYSKSSRKLSQSSFKPKQNEKKLFLNTDCVGFLFLSKGNIKQKYPIQVPVNRWMYM